MSAFALLTLAGSDRPGMVLRASQVLYETGCNIEDSSMTRLRGEFVVMLILRLADGVTPALLQEKLAPVARELALQVTVKLLEPREANRRQPDESPPGTSCIISVLGADKPGIVYHVTRVLAAAQGNITDLSTQVIGSAQRPAYTMLIEADLPGDLEPLAEHLTTLARELGVEISVRAADVFEL